MAGWLIRMESVRFDPETGHHDIVKWMSSDAGDWTEVEAEARVWPTRRAAEQAYRDQYGVMRSTTQAVRA